ncbi:MAG: ABC transporter permease subunit [Gammaproteobacteria bacterium]|nr:ABC transporter permease subunit [Gammaproteobacteria bacterium]
MSIYVFKRAAFTLVTFVVVVSATFFLLRIAPGGPFDSERQLPPEVEANLLAAYHLDEPLYLQYLRYMGNLVRFDLGPSIKQHDFTVSELIAAGLPVSLCLGALALLIALTTGVAIGSFAAFRHNSWLDRCLSATTTLGLALPPIVTGPLLVLLFAVSLRWLPAGGLDSYLSFVLPSVALALPLAAAIAKLVRGACIEVMDQPHVTTAKAKGISNVRLAFHHVLPAGMIPILSFLGPASAALLVGSLVIEEVFALPGLGRYFVQGALNRDYTLVMGGVVVYALLILILNFVVDLVYVRLDPRIRIEDQAAAS